MIYSNFQDKPLSLLGFGAMRLPLKGKDPADIDEVQTAEMIRIAMEGGVNYFDTAYPYHSGQSERVMGRLLKAYPRESYYLATKYPGHQISESYDPQKTFEEQLEKCGVDYFDFYLLHNVYEDSAKTYMDPKWGILDYFLEQKRLGRIRHLGFSFHGREDCLREFLDFCGDKMEFCQLQINYVDWTLQNAKEKYEMVTARGIPVWVMEPVRGGKLANLPEGRTEQLRTLCPEESTAAWAFRWLQGLPNVKMILSGMSNVDQVQDNLKNFGEKRVLSEEEMGILGEIAEELKSAIPCTACRYCCDTCPMGLDIPMLIQTYNEIRSFAPSLNLSMRMESLVEDKRPEACIACGKCTELCPQSIDIPQVMQAFAEAAKKLPSWAEICRKRAELQKKAAEN